MPGGGRGRRDQAGGSGVYPASAGTAPADAFARTRAQWGQGGRGAAGYDDAGVSELDCYSVQLEAAASARDPDGRPQEKEKVAARRRIDCGAW